MTQTKINIQLKPVSWLKPYEKNAKLHPQDEVERLAKTIKRFGWDQPIVTDKNGVIIKGHGRRLAAIHLGMAEVPVWIRDDISTTEADALRIADNAAIGMRFDTSLIQEELKKIMDDMPELDLNDLALTEKDKTLLTEILDTPNLDSIMDDTFREIEEQKEAEKETIAQADNSLTSLNKVLGFSKVTKSQERILNEFLIEAEEATGKSGADAFTEGLKIALQRGLN